MFRIVLETWSRNYAAKLQKISKTSKNLRIFFEICAFQLIFVPLHRQINKLLRNMKKSILFIALMLACMITAIMLTCCNVTRTITNESRYFQKGDTSIVIQTKTIETYDASKK